VVAWRIPLRLLCATIASLALAALLPASAAAVFYPSPRIAYFDRSGFGPAVDAAARQFNAIASPIHLTKVRSARKADIVVSSVARLPRGSNERAGRGGPGFVILSREALRLDGLVRQTNVAAHEFGHALGLAHTAGQCDLMYFAATTWACNSKGNRYRCGPGPRDVRQLARVWGWKPKITATTGYCRFNPPAAELTADDVPEMTLQSDGRSQHTIHFYVRNRSNSPWVDETLAVPTDANGRYLDTGCLQTDGGYVATEMTNRDPVKPGQVADFEVFVCGNPGQTKTFHFRLASKWFSPKPFVFDPMWTVRVHFAEEPPIVFGPPPLP
jgi:hypothetical protein